MRPTQARFWELCLHFIFETGTEWLLIIKADFSSILLTHHIGWVLPLEFTLNPTTNSLSFCQQYIPSHVPRKSLSFSYCSGLAMCPTSCLSHSPDAVGSPAFRFVASPLSHSSSAALCDGRNLPFSRELCLLNVKWLEQGEWAAFIPAVWVQILTQIGSKSQPIKQIIQDTSFSLKTRPLCSLQLLLPN